MPQSFIINEKLLDALDQYDFRSKLLQEHLMLKKPYQGILEQDVNDDLMYHVPIYDTANRRFAAFCAFTEAIWYGDKDPRNIGKHFGNITLDNNFDWFMLFYLFRLCGSGINYNPRIKVDSLDDIINTHGFGNFWVVDSILNNKTNYSSWLKDLKTLDKPFTNNKGYLLPQFSFKNQKDGHLKRFILDYSIPLIEQIYSQCQKTRMDIYQITDLGNSWLNSHGFNKQNFVLTAFAADLAEYFPNLVDPKSFVYAGTNATKCIKAIFPKSNRKVKEFDYINDVLQFQSSRYNLNPIDCEDSRNCDVVRYFKEYQSKEHIRKNNNQVMKNNSILKTTLSDVEYNNFVHHVLK